MKKVEFNHDWTVAAGAGSTLEGLFGAAVPAVSVTLPHDAVIGTKRKDTPGGAATGFYKGENIHYNKTFTPTYPKGGACFLQIEGAYQETTVYVNGSYVGYCPYGYGEYFLDITDYAPNGKSADVQIVVKNSGDSGRWYTGGGLYRDVSLQVGGRIYVAPGGCRVSTEYVREGGALLRVEIPLACADGPLTTVNVQTQILDSDKNVVATDTAVVTISRSEEKTLRRRIYIANPLIWDLDSPNLYGYTVTVTTQSSGEILDEDSGTFGIRTLQLDTGKGFQLNGRTVKLRGGCVHADNGILGTATFADAEYRRVAKMKEAGYNAIRMAHHPASRHLLNACDRLGMLVMEEFTDAWTTSKVPFDYGTRFAEYWESDIASMVRKDFNHPSVVLYSVGNEIPETGDRIDTDWGRKLSSMIRELDDTRFTVNCVNMMLSSMSHVEEILAAAGVQDNGTREINSFMNSMQDFLPTLVSSEITGTVTQEAFDQVDVAGYNYAAFRYESDLKRFSDRIIVGSETNPADLAYNWSLVESSPRIIGDFVWTACDYLGEAGLGKIDYDDQAGGFMGEYPYRSAYCGTLNLIGDRQPSSYWREIVWGLRTKPYIAVCPPKHYGQKRMMGQWGFTDGIHSWDWAGFEGKPIHVEVYAPTGKVALYINGRLVGECQTGDSRPFEAVFDTVYEPGEVRAVYTDADGKEFTDEIRTTGNGSEVRLFTKYSKIQKGCQSLAFVEISITDARGDVDMTADNEVTVKLQGPATLQGLGSANPCTEEGFDTDTCKVFEGRALAAIRLGETAGEVVVKVSAQDCKPQEITLTVE